MNTEPKTPRVVLGTMTFGKQVDEQAAATILELFFATGSHEIDTAYDYGKGATEEILGRILTPAQREQIFIATKANPGPRADCGRKVSAASLRLRCSGSGPKPSICFICMPPT